MVVKTFNFKKGEEGLKVKKYGNKLENENQLKMELILRHLLSLF